VLRLSIQKPASLGRFLPLEGVQIVGVFHLLDEAAYKAVQWVAAVAVVAAVMLLASVITRSKGMPVLVGSLAVPLIQLRAWFDGWWQFFLQQPTVVITACASLTLLITASSSVSRRRIFLVGAVSTWGLLLLFSNIAPFLFPIWLGVALARFPKKQGRTTVIAAMSGPWIAALAINLVLQQLASAPYATGFDAAVVGRTFAKQAIGTLPLSYDLLAHPQWRPDFVGLPTIAGVVLVAVTVVGVSIGIALMVRLSCRDLVLQAGIGAGLLLLPALAVAVSRQWQESIEPGLVYIPVVTQSVGLALLAGATIGGLVSWLRTGQAPWRVVALVAVSIALASSLGLSAFRTRQNNARAVDLYAANGLYLDAIETAVAEGFVDESSSPVRLLGRFKPWFRPVFLRHLGADVSFTRDAAWARSTLLAYYSEPRTGVVVRADGSTPTASRRCDILVVRESSTERWPDLNVSTRGGDQRVVHFSTRVARMRTARGSVSSISPELDCSSVSASP